MDAAVPGFIEEKRISIEFVKDITSSLLLSDNTSNTNFTMGEYLEHYKDLSARDLFTGLNNKDSINQEITNALQSDTPFRFAFIDLNYFKNVNDTFGHVSGDEVLLYLTNLLMDLENKTKAKAGRIGGDEFAFICFDENFDLDGSLTKMNEALKEHPFYKGDVEFHCDFAFGLTHSEDDDTLDTLLDRADKLMYKHKRAAKERQD